MTADRGYATWRPEDATDLPDGLADTKMVPLVEELRRRGYTTLQSCQGHPPDERGRNASDGHLWVDVTDTYWQWQHHVAREATRFCDTASITHLRDAFGGLVRIEFVWPAEQTDEVCRLILRLLTPLEPAEDGCSEHVHIVSDDLYDRIAEEHPYPAVNGPTGGSDA